jgi:DNA-binding NarL/FixJ family response regulator
MVGISTSVPPRTIALMSRQPLIRLGFQNMIESAEPPRFVMHPQRVPDALAAEQQPDVVILDLETEGDAVGRIKQIRESAPNSKILLLTGFEEQERMREVFSCGVDGVIPTVHPPAVVLATIEALFSPENHRGEAVGRDTVGGGEQTKVTQWAAESGTLLSVWPDTVTEREREVIRLVHQGLSNKEIAHRLCIAGSTVRHHLTNIFNKVGVPNRQKLLVRAHEFRSAPASPP